MSIKHSCKFRGLRKNTQRRLRRQKAEWEGRRIRSYHFFEKVPDKSQFSRAFARIAELKIMDKVQE
jgi:hypothetical protein